MGMIATSLGIVHGTDATMSKLLWVHRDLCINVHL
jgi:hypothetical protein